MYPKLFNIDFANITIYTYGVCIAIGALLAIHYTTIKAKNELGVKLSLNFFYLIFIAGFIGGKIFFYLENPLFYIKNPSAILSNLSGGFVFYGSFLFILPLIIWYLKKHKIEILPLLDILAITVLIVHAIGRIGCFFAGCCYGDTTNSSFGLVFPTTHGQAVHPTQLYESFTLFIIMILLLFYKKHQQFKGQLFLIYIALYGSSRIILELFRNDTRGFIINNVISHSQAIALCLIAISTFFYFKLNKQLN